MKKIIVFGTGDFSDVVSYVIEAKMQRTIEAYVINQQYITQSTYNDKPLKAFEDIATLFPKEEYAVVLGFIGKKMFTQRQGIFCQLKELGYELLNVIDPTASVDTSKIGEGNIILANCSIENHCVIGDANIIWPNVVMPHHNAVGSFNNLAPSVSLSGYSKVGSNCFVGNNSCIKNRVMIGDFSYIGAGAYITKDTESESVWVPNRSYELPEKSGYDFL